MYRGATLSTSEPAPHEDKVLLALTLVIGAVVGLVVVAFIVLTERLGSRMYPAGGAAWRRVLIPLAGSLLTGFLMYRYVPDARGSGIPQTKVALFLHDGYISLRTVLGKFGLCSVSLASGIALGREGPAVQMGAGIASVLGRRLGLSPASVRALVPVGAAAALAAAFNTPIAAVLFSLEEVMGDMHAPVLGSIVISSATSWMVLHLVLGDEPLFHVPAYQLVHPAEFLIYAVLGLAGGLVSVGFVKLLLWLRLRFRALPAKTRWMQPAIGGLTVGLLGWFYPDVLGVGYAFVGQALNGQIVIGTMALLVLLKIIATATCYSSGNAGGIFGPSLFIGAMLGGAIGGVAHGALPDYTGSAGAYALVGMGAAFAGIVRVPLTSVIMIFEVTRDYSIIVPLMIANLVSYFISSRLQEKPVYEALQHQDGIHLPSGAGAREELLMVGNAYRRDVQPLLPNQPAAEALGAVEQERGAWPVEDAGGLLGMVTLAQLRDAPPWTPLNKLLRAGAPHLHTDQSLDTAMRRLAESGLPALPVVSRTNLRELKGTLTVTDVLAAYAMARATQSESPATARLPRRRLVAAGLALVIGLALAAGLSSTYYRAKRASRAEFAFRTGNQLFARERYDEAIVQYRDALSASHGVKERLALGQALPKAHRPAEALIYLEEVLREQPANARAHLAIARIDADAGRIDDAVAHYQRAIYGAWADRPDENRVAARLELIDALEKAGRGAQAAGELSTLAAARPGDVTLKKRIAQEFAELGMNNRALEFWRDVTQRNPNDAEAQQAMGEIELAMNEFAACRESFRAAHAEARAELCSTALTLDPTVHGLSAHERRRRSKALLAGVREELAPCKVAAPDAGGVSDDLEIAERLWQQRAAGCASLPRSESAVARVMGKLLSQ